MGWGSKRRVACRTPRFLVTGTFFSVSKFFSRTSSDAEPGLRCAGSLLAPEKAYLIPTLRRYIIRFGAEDAAVPHSSDPYANCAKRQRYQCDGCAEPRSPNCRSSALMALLSDCCASRSARAEVGHATSFSRREAIPVLSEFAGDPPRD
jgi:hypothetical protein